MELVEIKYELPLSEYSEEKVKYICNLHSASLKEVIMSDDKAILVMRAPSHWRLILAQSILQPLRYM